MPAYFGDIGKSVKDLLTGGYQYDYKGSHGLKTDAGVTLTLSGKKKGDAVSGDLKAAYKLKGMNIDCGLGSGKFDSTVTVDDVIPGLKAAISGAFPEKESGKLALTYTGIKSVGAKCDVALKKGSKFNANCCYASGALTGGASVALDLAKGSVSKYELGCQYEYSKSSTISALLVDNADTLKLGYFYKMSGDTSVGGECVHKLKAGATSFAVGGLKKLDSGASAKGSVTDKGVVSMQYSQELRPKTTGVFSCQFDLTSMDKGAKHGLEIKVKA